MWFNGLTMPDDASVDAVRAAAATFAPPVDGRPGAADLGVERHIVELIEQALPGFVDLIAALLNAFAAEVRAVPFADLTDAERTQVLRTMSTDESRDVRDAVDYLLVFTMGGLHSEWTGYDKKTRKLQPPKVWERMRFAPALGHPNYRVDI